ncbi:hypothetical protein [Quadrisphaera setariae]|uniref:Uncharacterized protein n=1 Tax=Quadrisphaera setariae TaxID=2593304 RepID=A0A5C8ZK50_9ACTN|nr:hypothetical protein [Quadrisphaera setariae]TXR57994.1 hypothetical protein FMM08_01875 [Quadrisphaera setariae]
MDFISVEALLKNAVRALVRDDRRLLDELRGAPAASAERVLAAAAARQVARLLPEGWDVACTDRRPTVVTAPGHRVDVLDPVPSPARPLDDAPAQAFEPVELAGPDVVVRLGGPAEGDAALLALAVRASQPVRGGDPGGAVWRALTGFVADGHHQHGVVLHLGLDHPRGAHPAWQWAASGAAAADVAPVRVFSESELDSLLASRGAALQSA